ncbi:raptor N-terminal caspase like domain-containing protein [Thamnocephalis sphaerospora]|uniref:Raptor N-terminal caspase like domain-containing protein n=1 Tax=Thamnocephalis sphaerospora TaxID=78915 RepID=A0A4P9XVE7_9FUNG|nr:raptor N-terminal caspase like domain-containing protein [Thamnocephalis sphaerospora]|eukprot:RKP10243.1 raptor N-terminal caspase like domain-containing protein [Thamnocephalis sphaerospora]
MQNAQQAAAPAEVVGQPLEGYYYLYFAERRHESQGDPARVTSSRALEQGAGGGAAASDDNGVGVHAAAAVAAAGSKDKADQKAQYPSLPDWRMRERVKTVSVLLTLCLNIGVDPPDVVKTSPCARLECWMDPFAMPVQKSLDAIARALQQQYEVWQPRARYKLLLDPAVEEAKRLCTALRRGTREDRILFHYNGHGVPKPTASGEIWVFNRSYTQYIPVSLYDLQTWLGSPCIYVYDCSAAGNIVAAFDRFAAQRDAETEPHAPAPAELHAPMRECIQLAACGANEVLPMNPNLPADLFSACLTTPIPVALRWFVLQNPILGISISPEDVMKLPGRLNDRRTPLGELNWIFTAVTDTIAWNVLPQPLFKRLFRQDMVVAALFRNFLLADRVMRSYKCTPVSSPALPSTHQHPMWQAWDLAVDMCVMQIPALLKATQNDTPLPYRPSTFFAEQLTAFETWLQHGSVTRSPPEQLPIVLQVLLSQVHRLRALLLLSRFLDLGAWAVHHALAVGIFPYVLKLLQSPAVELRPVLIFIWARMLAVDHSCAQDLSKDNGYLYFLNVLAPSGAHASQSSAQTAQSQQTSASLSEHRAMCAFVISVFCRHADLGQRACLRANVMSMCITHARDPDPLLRQWCCLCIGELWRGYADAKWVAIRENAHEHLFELLGDPMPEVRAAALYALGTLLGDLDLMEQVINVEHNIAVRALAAAGDASPLVRRELVCMLSIVVHRYASQFTAAATALLEHDRQKLAAAAVVANERRQNRRVSALDGEGAGDTMYACVWCTLLVLSVDPFPSVAALASGIVDYVHDQIYDSGLVNAVLVSAQESVLSPRVTSGFYNHDAPSTPTSRITSTLRRSASGTISTLRNLYNIGYGFTTGLATPNAQVPSRTVEKLGPVERLPVASKFFTWCCTYFLEPQTKPAEADEPGSESYNARLWRRSRNERVLYETIPMQEGASEARWDMQMGTLHEDTDVQLMRFHTFEPHLVTSDGKNAVSIWSWEEGARLNKLWNDNSIGSRITALDLLNEEDLPLLMVGSDDGMIRIYRDYHAPQKTELVTSWRALIEMLPSNRGSGLITDWQQSHGTLLISGDSRIVRVWDAAREVCAEEIPTHSDSCITSLTSDPMSSNIFIAGCGDGVIRVFDRRNPPRESLVITWNEHPAWVLDVHLQRGGQQDLMSASMAGDIKIWDVRQSDSVITIDADREEMSSFVVHDHVAVMASGSLAGGLQVWNTMGKCIGNGRTYSGILGQRPAAPTALAFHPRRSILAHATADRYISLVGSTIRSPMMDESFVGTVRMIDA